MDVRAAEAAEIGRLARLWHEGWNDAHAEIVPAELARLRTLESFEERLRAGLPDVLNDAETSAGTFQLEVWRYEKSLIN